MTDGDGLAASWGAASHRFARELTDARSRGLVDTCEQIQTGCGRIIFSILLTQCAGVARCPAAVAYSGPRRAKGTPLLLHAAPFGIQVSWPHTAHSAGSKLTNDTLVPSLFPGECWWPGGLRQACQTRGGSRAAAARERLTQAADPQPVRYFKRRSLPRKQLPVPV